MDSPPARLIDPRILEVMTRVKQNLNLRLSCEHLAREVNLSPSRLRHLFKSEIGMTPSQYAKTLRINKAKELAVSTFLNVKEIIAKLGNFDQSHFLRDFKRGNGETLTQYRRRRSQIGH